MRCGIAPYSRRLALGLSESGCDVTVVADKAGADESQLQMYRMRSWSLREVVRLALSLDPRARRILHLQHPTRATRLKPSVYLLPLLVRILRPRARTVTTFHYIRPVDARTALLRVFFLVPAVASHAIVVTTAREASYIRAILPWKRVIVAPAGITFETVQPGCDARRAVRERLGFQEDDFVVAYFGFLVPNKGIETLLQAAAAAPAATKLLVIGGAYEDGHKYESDLRDRAAEPGLAGRVVWTGTVSDTVSGELLGAADCASLPYDEGASFKRSTLMAALQVGLPVVTTRGPELDPAMRDGENLLLVKPHDARALASAIDRLRLDGALRRRLANGGRDLLTLVSWDTITERHLALYDELMRA
jgi:polysaccharide biosynthesis protein PslF